MAKRRLPKPKTAGSTPVIRSILRCFLKLKRGSRGSLVKEVQQRLIKLGYSLGHTAADGNFGEKTEKAVREFQKKHGLPQTGIVDDVTYEKIVYESYFTGDRLLYLHYPFMRGRDVREIQESLAKLGFNPGKIDGIFGPATDKAVREFQMSVGIIPDGIVGPQTLKEIEKNLKSFNTEKTLDYPLRGSDKDALLGVKVAVDAGHGGKDSGAVSKNGMKESVYARKIASSLIRLLTGLGAVVIQVYDEDDNPPLPERVNAANNAKADFFISIHLNASTNPSANGVEVLYFGTEISHSIGGKKLASIISREISNSLKIRNRGAKKRSDLYVLKHTSMPAVIVEPLFITNPEEEKLLENSGVINKIGAAITRALLLYTGRVGM